MSTHPAAPLPYNPDEVMVRMRNIVKRFGTTTVLDGVDLDVHQGEVVAVLGPSGSGKSTFLRCINRLETIDRGFIEVDGEQIGYKLQGERLTELTHAEIARQRRHIGMVFQQFNLFPHMTVMDNVTMAQRDVLGRSLDEARERGAELLERVGMGHKQDAYPGNLSGGQQQRVAIARALAMDPAVMLFDEPTSALDPELVGEVLDVMRQLADDGMTMMVVTHEMRFARKAADRVVLLADGGIAEQGPPAQVLDSPSSERGKAFLNELLHH